MTSAEQFYLSVKSLTLLKSWIATLPMLGFLATDWLTGNVGLGVAVSAGFSVLTAVIVTRPKIIAAKAAALVNTTNAADAHLAAVVKQLTDIHERSMSFWKAKCEQHEKTEILIRATKHKAFGAYQAATWVIRDMQEVLKTHGIQFTPFKPESFREITGHEDESMISILLKDSI
jgi:hypothetical protein